MSSRCYWMDAPGARQEGRKETCAAPEERLRRKQPWTDPRHASHIVKIQTAHLGTGEDDTTRAVDLQDDFRTNHTVGEGRRELNKRFNGPSERRT